MDNKLVVVSVLVVAALGGFLLFKNSGVAPTDLPNEENATEEGSTSEELAIPAPPSIPTPPPPPAPSASAVREFVIDNDHFSYKPSSLSVNKGDTVKITFRNTGGTHDLKIDEFDAATRLLKAGEEQTITFVADESGSFQYYCSVGNHRAQGMWGTLTVR